MSPEVIILLPVLLFSLSLHEFGHAFAAFRGGDDTASLQGRMTLNPLAHIDPVGTILIPLIQLFGSFGFALIGWAKPVPVNPARLRSARWDIIVSLAGVALNLACVIVALIAYKIFLLLGFSPFRSDDAVTTAYMVSVFLRGLIMVNLALMMFNLIPIPPLDGSHVFLHMIRARNTFSFRLFEFLERFGFIVLLVLINLPMTRSFFTFIIGNVLRVFSVIFQIDSYLLGI